jgi:hypothetical protein
MDCFLKMTQQQQKLEQLEKQQQQKFNEVEEKMSEMSSSFTFRLFTIPFGLLMLILCLFHMMRNIKASLLYNSFTDVPFPINSKIVFMPEKCMLSDFRKN